MWWTPTLAAVAIAGWAFLATPAGASHQNGYSHWGHGWRPAVLAPQSSIWPYTSDAELMWPSYGYPNGFCVGSCPWWATPANCSDNNQWVGGGIKVCWHPPGTGMLRWANGRTLPHYTSQGHITAMRVWICDSCWTDVFTITRHEYGHAIGLGHDTTASVGLMRQPSNSYYPSWHDTQALTQFMYNGHYDP